MQSCKGPGREGVGGAAKGSIGTGEAPSGGGGVGRGADADEGDPERGGQA